MGSSVRYAEQTSAQTSFMTVWTHIYPSFWFPHLFVPISTTYMMLADLDGMDE